MKTMHQLHAAAVVPVAISAIAWSTRRSTASS
jgi:hypothetical protein